MQQGTHEQVAKADCECLIYITYTNVNGYLIPNLTYKSGEQLEEKEPLPDKEVDQMAWVRVANQHRAIAEEIILKELIYV